VLGGSLLEGQLSTGDEVEIRPGVKKKNAYKPIITRISSLSVGSENVDTVKPGGLIAVGTELDPSLTKSDNLSGSVIGTPGSLPEVRESLSLNIKLIDRLVNIEGNKLQPLVKGEPLMVSSGSAVTVGVIINPSGELNLKLPICVDTGSKVALSRRIGARWHLIGYGIVKD